MKYDCNVVILQCFFLFFVALCFDMEGSDTAMNQLRPAISLVSRRVMASPVSALLSGAAPRPSPGPDSAPAGVYISWHTFVE